MFHYQLLSNVEQAFNLLEFCVFVGFRLPYIIGPRWTAAFIDEVINILHIIEDVVSLADIPNLFREN